LTTKSTQAETIWSRTTWTSLSNDCLVCDIHFYL
jgi:hypothetical protein